MAVRIEISLYLPCSAPPSVTALVAVRIEIGKSYPRSEQVKVTALVAVRIEICMSFLPVYRNTSPPLWR